MLSKDYIVLAITALISVSCKQNSKVFFPTNKKEVLPLINNINHIVDSLSTNFPKEYPVNLFTVSHQKKKNKDFIKISTSEYYNKDSIAGNYLHNGKIVVLYSKSFFEKMPLKIGIDKNLELDDEKISLYHKRFVVFEIKNNGYKIINNKEFSQMELFNYDDRYVPEPVPNN